MTLIERIHCWLQTLWLALSAEPIRGADDDADDDDKDAADKDSDDADDDSKSDDDEDSDKDKDPESAQLRRKLAEARKAEREANKKLKKAEEQKAKDEGKWKDLAEQREREKEEAEEKLAKAESARAVEKVAKRLEFEDPDDAHRFLDADVDADDEAGIERELKAVLEAKPHLKKDERSRGSGPTRTRRRESGKPDMDKVIRRKAGRA